MVTTSVYTQNEDFTEADGVFPELGDEPDAQVRLGDLIKLGTVPDSWNGGKFRTQTRSGRNR